MAGPRSSRGRAPVSRFLASCLAAVTVAAVGGVVGLTAGSVGAAAPTACATAAKTSCFALVVAPTSVSAGTITSFSFTVSNLAKKNIGSLEITAPAGFLVTAASGGTKGSSASHTTSSVTFHTLGLVPSGATVIKVTAAAPCNPTAYTWGIEVQPSSKLTGAAGTDFRIEPGAAALSGSVTGQCSVAFVNEPKGTTTSSAILTGFHSTGTALKAEVLTAAGTVMTTFTGTVTLSLSSDPTGVALAGTSTEPATAGVATFGNLSAADAGVGYRFEATSPGITGTPPSTASSFSSYFTIYAKLKTCTTGTCAATASGTKVTITGSTTTAPAGGFIGFGFGGVASFSCGSYVFGTPANDTANFDVLTTGGTGQAGVVWTVVYTIEKALVLASTHPGASKWQICYASPTPFKAQPKTTSTVTLGGVTYHVGLLTDCPANLKHSKNTKFAAKDAPCVISRHKNNAGNEIVTFLATGDPTARG